MTAFTANESRCGSIARLGRSQHGVSFRLEFRSRLPFKHDVAVCHAVTNEKIKLGVLDRATHVPIALNLVGGLVVVLGGIFLPHIQAPTFGPAYEIDPPVWIKRGHAFLGEAEMIGPIEVSFLRFGIGL